MMKDFPGTNTRRPRRQEHRQRRAIGSPTTETSRDAPKTNDSQKYESNFDQEKHIKEHPIRTDEWCVTLHISLFCRFFSALSVVTSRSRVARNLDPLRLLPHEPASRNPITSLLSHECCQRVILHRNGYVLVVENNNNFSRRQTKIGKWMLNTNSIFWEIPVRIGLDEENVRRLVQVQYTADVLLNRFGTQPRMIRGIVTRDRSYCSFLPQHFLRPVIATFTATGVGEDTSDITYKNRSLGLPKGNA